MRYRHEDLLKTREITTSTNRSFSERLLFAIGIAINQLGRYLVEHHEYCDNVQSGRKSSSHLKSEKNGELAKWSLN